MNEDTERRYREIMKRPKEDAGHTSAVVVFVGYVCALVSLVLLPPAFAIAGLVCGIVGVVKKNEIQGVIVIVLSIVCGIVGMYFGYQSMSR